MTNSILHEYQMRVKVLAQFPARPQTTLSCKLGAGHGLNLGAGEAIVFVCCFVITDKQWTEASKQFNKIMFESQLCKSSLNFSGRFKVITSHHVNVFVAMFIAETLTGSGAAFQLPENDQKLSQAEADKHR